MMSNKIRQFTRSGAYGVIVQDSKILLTRHTAGPFTGLWGLPGGGIEFGESPEEALRRELLEEVALTAGRLKLQSTATAVGESQKNGEPYAFHHIGIIYEVADTTLVPHLVPEDEGRWFALDEIKLEELAPFVKHVLEKCF